MKILITGAAGQLGRAVRLELEPRHEVLTTDLEDLDVRDLSALRAYVSAQRPGVILHLAALTQVDVCEQRPEAAFEVNTLGTRYVALAAREVGAELAVLSSDYVFNGRASSPYREYDNPDPINVYGRSKLGGERAVTSLLEAHYVVRTSGLFGPGGANFVAAILAAHRRDGRVKVVRDQVCRPTYAGDLARALARMVGSGNYGIYHVASAGETSWFEFARAILKAAGENPGAAEPIGSDALARPAARPPYSVLDTRSYELTFGHVLPHWDEGLKAYFAEA